jgi:hypothetical protein
MWPFSSALTGRRVSISFYCWWHNTTLLHHLNMPGAPQPCEEKKRLRAAYTDALEELRQATAVLRREQYGPGFLDALEKTQQARTMHDAARRGAGRPPQDTRLLVSYVPFQRKILRGISARPWFFV